MSATSNRRAACDRCHRLKMRCVSDTPGSQQHCNRCRGAGTPCHYSVPGKPGRPQSQPARVVAPEATTIPRAKPQSVYPSPSFRSPCLEGSHFDYGTLSSIEGLPSLSLGATDWTMLSVGGDGQNDLDRSPNIWSGDYSTDYFRNITQLKEPGTATGKAGIASYLPTIGGAPFGDNTQYLQQLSEFNTRLCLQTKLEPTTATADQIQLASAQILETSSVFLQLVSGADGSTDESSPNDQTTCYITSERTLSVDVQDDQADDQDEDEEMETGSENDRRNFESHTAALLQLLVISMRITELYCSLYSAILDYLRRHDEDTNSSVVETASASTSSLKLHSDSISILGITLTPKPKFQLQLILQLCAHYLGSSK